MNTHGTFRYKLLTGVAACALLLAVEGTPVRAEPAQNWWLSVHGQYQFWNGQSTNTATQFGALGDGFGGGAEFGWKLDDIHSIVVRGKIGRTFGKNSSQSGTTPVYGPYGSYGGYPYSETTANKSTSFVGDLEIGRDVGLGALGLGEGDLRAFVGARIANLSSNSSFQSSYSSFGSTDRVTRRSFTGAGPRIGFTASKPLSESVAFDLGVAGGVLIGRQKETEAGYSGFGSYDNSDSRTAVVPNVEASAALKFLFNEDTTFSAGYKVDAYFDAIGNFGGPTEDRIIHGPFVQFTIKN